MTPPWFLCRYCEGLMLIQTVDDDGNATSRCERCGDLYAWNLDDMIPDGPAPDAPTDPTPDSAEDKPVTQ